MSNKNTLWEVEIGQWNAFLTHLAPILGTHGKGTIAEFLENPDEIESLGHYMLKNVGFRGDNIWPSKGNAREIMGDNYISLREAITAVCDNESYQVELRGAVKGYLDRIPYKISTLEECKDSHVLVPLLPVKLTDLHRRFPERIQMHKGLHKDPLWEKAIDEKYSNSIGMEWKLIRREVIGRPQAGKATVHLSVESQIPVPTAAYAAFVYGRCRKGSPLFQGRPIHESIQAKKGGENAGFFTQTTNTTAVWMAKDFTFEVGAAFAKKHDS